MTTEGLPVVLLVGGSGSRMGDEAGGVPKPLVAVGGRPILWHVMKLYAHYGHTSFIFPLGYKGEAFRRYFLEYESFTYDMSFSVGRPDQRVIHNLGSEGEWEVTLFDAGLRAEKGERIYHAVERLQGETFFATYGDGIGDIDIAALYEFHHSHGKLATLTGFQPFSQYGVVDVDDDGRVNEIREKPRMSQWINAGFFVFEVGVRDYLTGDQVDLEQQALPKLAKDGELMMYKHTGYWASMDTFKDARNLNDDWENSAPWRVWKD